MAEGAAPPQAGQRMARRVLIIVENLPVPFDRRVWQEARTLRDAGYQVAVICPTGRGHEQTYEHLEGIHIYRHPLPLEGKGPLGFLLEYGAAVFHEFRLAWRVLNRHGFDAIHACNPPDLIFLVGGFFKLFLGKRFLFDHHDINPELFEAKFGRRGFFWHLVVACEWLTFKTASVVISTNDSYRRIAIERGGKKPEDVFVVRSGPSLERLRHVAPDPALKQGRAFLVGYVGVIGQQEGMQYLVEAARHLIVTLGRRDIHFGVVGDGPALHDIRALAQDRGVADYFTFTGRASDALLLAMLSTADVCVNPDEVNPMNDKSTMNKIMEYMSLGKPIVQFDLTEGRFSARDASLYARPNDAVDFAEKIAGLLADPDRRAAMGAIGKHRIETELQWTYEAPRLLAAYDRLFR